MSMKDLRPISLCNVVYKMLAKVLANRLKVILPELIDEAQSSFVLGRAIIDNVILAFETIHSMKMGSKRRMWDVALNIDISKAYDRLKWDYILEVMTKMGFEPVWADWMRICITVSYSVLMNEDLVGPIIPRRGLRQGDPLSPYLFVIGTEGLSSLINQAVSRGEVHGIKVCRGAPEVTHLLFADDSLFFFQAAEYECLKRQNILTK